MKMRSDIILHLASMLLLSVRCVTHFNFLKFIEHTIEEDYKISCCYFFQPRRALRGAVCCMLIIDGEIKSINLKND